MKWRQKAVRIWAYASLLLLIAIIVFMFAYIFAIGGKSISWRFLTDVPRGGIIGSEGGILPAIVGSLYFTIVACALGAVLGIATAIYLVFYCKRRRVATLIQTTIQGVAGVPSIVLGLFGYTLLVLRMGLGKSVLAGGIAQGIMILPFIEVRAEKVMHEFPRDLINASYALGVSKLHTIYKIVLPGCMGGLVSGIILGGCYAMGATAPLIFTGAVINSPVPTTLLEPAMALPYHLLMLLTQGTSTENAYGTAFVLMAIVLVSNGLATFYANRRSKLWK